AIPYTIAANSRRTSGPWAARCPQSTWRAPTSLSRQSTEASPRNHHRRSDANELAVRFQHALDCRRPGNGHLQCRLASSNQQLSGGRLRGKGRPMALWNELRFATRQLRKTPGFTLTVLVTLALCGGVNTAIFSVLDAVLFRPAPFPEPDRLALLVTAQHGRTGEDINTSQKGALFEAGRDHSGMLDCAAWSGIGGAHVSAGGRPEYIQQQRVSADYFRVLGVPPQMGREFLRAEDVPNGAAVAVLSHDFWQRAFHGDPAILGRAINLKGEPHT